MANYIVTADGTADINDAAGTDQYLMEAPFAGKINVPKCFVRWSEATGTQSSTVGTVLMKVGGNTVGTMTAPVSGSVADTTVFTVDGTYTTASDPWYPIAAGDAILFEIGTQATGGTVTGDGDIHICLEWATGV